MLRLWRLGEQVTVKTTNGNPCKKKAMRKRRRREKRSIIIIIIIIIRVKIQATQDMPGQAQR
jgi:hypothetical protein